MPEERVCYSFYNRILKDGTIVQRPRIVTYTAKLTIDIDIQKKIVELHNLHVPKIQISRTTGLSVKRINTVIKKHIPKQSTDSK